MKINKKWQAISAGALAIALVGGGASAANAAVGDPLNPQPAGSAAEGSKGGFFLFDPDAILAEQPGRVYAKDEYLFAAADDVDYLAEINPAATRPVTGATPFTGVWRFLAEKNTTDLMGGINTWNAYVEDAAAGPEGGTLTPAMTLEGILKGPGGIADDLAAGGSYWYGVAYTYYDGVQVAGAVYREINIEPGTGNYTVSPMVLESAPVLSAPAVSAQPASTSVARGANATFTAAATGSPEPTVQWQLSTNGTDWADVAGATSTTLTVANVQVAQTGHEYRAVFTNSEGTVTSNAATLTVTLPVPTEPVEGDANKLVPDTIELAEGATTASVTGSGLAAGTYNAWAWSTPTQLPIVTVDANGDFTVNLQSLEPGDHTIALVDPATGAIVGWFTVTIPQPANTSEVDLTATVITSNKFALEGVNPTVDFGDVARAGSVTKPLTPFTVTDDRNVLLGWNLTTAVDDFVNDGVDFAPNKDAVISKGALRVAPKAVGTLPNGIGINQPYDGAASTLFAEGIANSTTGAAGSQFDADLTFTAPRDAKAGVYNSTLTLTLTSK